MGQSRAQSASTNQMNKNIDKKEANRDPITGAPGAHPIGTGIGAAAGGAATGAAVGSVAGPVGTAVGIVAGAVVGGLAGKSAAEAIDPTREDAYWRDNYKGRQYIEANRPYEDYAPAYRTGYEGYTRYKGRTFEQSESDLQRDYERSRGASNLTWDRAKHATRDAWHKVERALPGDADRDGR
jgi:hypothetical protein